jgi:hypothetical protein
MLRADLVEYEVELLRESEPHFLTAFWRKVSHPLANLKPFGNLTDGS